ncbi:MAG: CHAT domain-containing protein [Verrucomicrobiales bacterium]|nr:CHAT domain-containing protein [Verrucomicrobiales bacterium]
MSARFDLIITANTPSLTADFVLRDEHGIQLAFRRTDFKTISVSHLQGLFDLRNYLRLYVEEGKEGAAVAEIGVCVAEEVLGKELFEKLWQSESHRTLCIALSGATDGENHLAAALARVPWEIARPRHEQPMLSERNLLVRVVHDMEVSVSEPVKLDPEETLRVLFVFAEARGSRPLGARQERRELLRMLEKEVYPQRRVVADFLTHGVTRERLEAQIRENGGYHVVHWSGHGHMNLLELARPGGEMDYLSGAQLLGLFIQAGGFLPRLAFLSACHSGDNLRVRDWNDFIAIALGREQGAKDGETKELDFKQQPGFTGIAHALLQGGVRSVVAMRYAVGDDYARELAVEFYRALFAHAQPKNVAAALTMARQAMLDAKKHCCARFAVCDHATPLLYGAEQPGVTLAKGRSPGLNPRNPRLHKITELTQASHEHFVGRTWDLTELGAEFIGSTTGAEAKPVAVITGMGGMGKTALVAEALALWETRFEWVLLYQAKPNALGFDAFLRDAHFKLIAEVDQRYHRHVKQYPADAIYRDATAEFNGSERLDRLTHNLLRALRDEPILVVLDNFETNLKAPIPGEIGAVCQDFSWDRCLSQIAFDLVGARSRVLITSRRPIAALPKGTVCSVSLGPLPPSEAALFLRAHPVLGGMIFGANATERSLAMRLFDASRFHPLLMDRLARLAGDPALRPQLLQALDALEKTKDFNRLPALFATRPGDAQELAYLDDALATSLDLLIGDVSADARRLLWIIALANDMVELALLSSVWSRENQEHGRLQEMKQMPDMMPPASLTGPDVATLLHQLVDVGLVTEERTGPDDANPYLSCHDLVCGRIRAWMARQPQDLGNVTENSVRIAFAERLTDQFRMLQHQNMNTAFHAGSRAVVYSVQAEAWDWLQGFASEVVISTRDPRLLEGLMPHLQTAAQSAPEGRSRWSCLCCLAVASRMAGRPDASLHSYEQAAIQAHAAAQVGGEASSLAWSDLAWITSNWAYALGDVGHPDAARQRLLEAAEAMKKAGRPLVDVIGSELEALRIDILQGQVDAALPQVEARLTQVERWWQRHCAGESVPEAPRAEFLARVFICALEIANEIDVAREDWASVVRRLDRMLEVQQALKRPADDIGVTRFNRASVLSRIPGQVGKARAELETCLQLFQSNPKGNANVLSSLAVLSSRQGDMVQAITLERRALAMLEQLPDPSARAVLHNNLANHLDREGTPSALDESRRHQLAALIYCLVADAGQALQIAFNNYGYCFRVARAADTKLVVPRVAELLVDPAFAPLEEWLRQRRVNLDELQSHVDQFLAQVRETALAQPML